MPTPILFSFRRCPYAMRARLSLALAGVEVEHREVLLRDKPTIMLQYSPKGTVPVLVLADGLILEESLDIMLWALGDSSFSNEASALIAHCDGPFKAALDRYKYASREELQEPGKSAVDYRSEGVSHLQRVDNYLSGEALIELTPLSCAILPFVRQFRGVDPDWFDDLPFSGLHKHLQYFLNSSLFARVMYKYPAWQDTDKPLLHRF